MTRFKRHSPPPSYYIQRGWRQVQQEVKKLLENNGMESISRRVGQIEDFHRIIEWISEVNRLAKVVESKKLRGKAYATKGLLLTGLYKKYPSKVKLVFQQDSMGCLTFLCHIGIDATDKPRVFHLPVVDLRKMGIHTVRKNDEVILVAENSASVLSIKTAPSPS